MTRKIISCFECHNGIMEELQNPHSFDFNKDGYVPRICNNCGLCNDVEHKTPERNIVKTRFSNRFINNILNILSDSGRKFDNQKQNMLSKKLSNMNICCCYNLAELIIEEAKEMDIHLNWDFVIFTIYSKSGAYLNISSYV